MDQTSHSTNYGGNAPSNYQQFFVPYIGAPVARDLVTAAHLDGGERVLDVACGTGVVAQMAAERVGPKGKVTGLDINPGMLEVARLSTPGELSVEWVEGDAQSMPFDDGAFDIVLCQMGLQFIPNKLAALREMHRVLAPGGRVLVSLPGPKPQLFGIMADAFARHIGQEGASFMDLVFSLHNASELRRLFEDSGFPDVEIDAINKSLVVPPSRDFLWQYIHSTPLAPEAANADERSRDDLEQDVCSKWHAFVVDGNIHFDVGITTVSASR